MSESANSSSVSITPAFVAAKFSQPTWEVRVNDVVVSDAILEKVDIGFGSDISSTTFVLPRSPFSSGNPVEGDGVKVYVNTKKIFDGKIKVKADHLGNDGLKITYTATSNITDLNRTTVKFGAFNSQNSDYNGFYYNVPGLFNILGIGASGVPNVYPGEVNVTDQTLLSAAESILNKVGNYKLYYDMETNILYNYALGTGGINTRSFIVGKNIINYNITRSTENIVDEVTVIGAPTQITVKQAIAPTTIGKSPSGRDELVFTLSGRNIRNITVEGLTREQPKIEFDKNVQINRAMLNKFDTFDIEEFDARTTSMLDSVQRNSKNVNYELKPLILSIQHYQSTWNQVPVSLDFVSDDLVHVYISEVPKIWKIHTTSGSVPNSAIGLDGEGNTEAEILDEFYFTVGPMRVTYTFDGSKPTATAGGGTVKRSINDSQYQIIIGPEFSSNNTNLMQARAQAEYDRLHLPEISGTITVLGDETIHLRSTLNISGDILDIIHITHNFIGGFTTDISVTNEKLRTNTIGISLQQRPNNAETERERRKGLLIQNQNADILRKKNQQTQSEKKNPDEPPITGPYSVYK